jgi:integrase
MRQPISDPAEEAATPVALLTDAAPRTIPLHPQLRPRLLKHIETMRADRRSSGTPILHTRHGTPILGRQIGRWLAEMSDRAGLDKRVNQQMRVPTGAHC